MSHVPGMQLEVPEVQKCAPVQRQTSPRIGQAAHSVLSLPPGGLKTSPPPKHSITGRMQGGKAEESTGQQWALNLLPS